MPLRDMILEEHSRSNSLRIAGWIGNDSVRFGQLMQLFLHDDYRVVQRAAWVINLVAEKHPALITPHLPAMIRRLEATGIPVAVKRNVLRLLQFLPVPEQEQGTVMNICFELLADVQETVAVRCFAMTILANMSADYPEIRNEISLIIEDQLENSPTAGFRARAKKVLKKIKS